MNPCWTLRAVIAKIPGCTAASRQTRQVILRSYSSMHTVSSRSLRVIQSLIIYMDAKLRIMPSCAHSCPLIDVRQTDSHRGGLGGYLIRQVTMACLVSRCCAATGSCAGEAGYVEPDGTCLYDCGDDVSKSWKTSSMVPLMYEMSIRVYCVADLQEFDIDNPHQSLYASGGEI